MYKALDMTYADFIQEVERNKAMYRYLYLQENLTAREVARQRNLPYTTNLQKALYRIVGSKGLGWGGIRPGSGNKPGTICGHCMNLKAKCKCN